MSVAAVDHIAHAENAGVADGEQLATKLAEACGYLNAAQARVIDAVSAALKTGAWQVTGVHEPAQWVGWQCGVSPQRARVMVEVAMRADELPVTFAAFRRGELGFDQVAPIARRVPDWADREACEFAKVLTVPQLTRSLAPYEFPDEPAYLTDSGSSSSRPDDPTNDNSTDDNEDSSSVTDDTTGGDARGDENPDGGSDREGDEPTSSDTSSDATTSDSTRTRDDGVNERCWFVSDGRGVWRFGGELAGDRGELFNQAVTEARDRLFQHGHTNVTWVDALIEVCERSLDHISDPARRDRYRIYLHLPLPDSGVDRLCRGAAVRTRHNDTDMTGDPSDKAACGVAGDDGRLHDGVVAAADSRHSDTGIRPDPTHHSGPDTGNDSDNASVTRIGASGRQSHDPANEPPVDQRSRRATPKRDTDAGRSPDPTSTNQKSPGPAMVGPLGHRLPDNLRRLLCCDATIVPVWERDGLPVSVGRSQRVVPDRTRRLVLLRDGGCRVPGCDNDRWLDIHHIVHWQDGGPTDTSNLVSLCKHHHRLHHRGRLGITGDADHPNRLVFTDQHGRHLRTTAAATPPEHPQPPPDGQYIHPIGEPFRTDDMYFNPPHHLRPHHSRRQ